MTRSLRPLPPVNAWREEVIMLLPYRPGTVLLGPGHYVSPLRYMDADHMAAQPEPGRRARRSDGKPVQGTLFGVQP